MQFSETSVSIRDLVLRNVEVASAPLKYYAADRIGSCKRRGQGWAVKVC